jgi:hypothetical protein
MKCTSFNQGILQLNISSKWQCKPAHQVIFSLTKCCATRIVKCYKKKEKDANDCSKIKIKMHLKCVVCQSWSPLLSKM